MNVIIQIQGREAIPVRAIPLLTYWHFFSPDVVAQTLAAEGFGRAHVHGELQAYRLEEGVVMVMRQSWWGSWTARELRAHHEKIKATGVHDEVGYQQWRDESLPILPASVFVWKEELESFHARNWDSRFRVVCGGIPEDDGEASMPSIDAKFGAYLRDRLADLEKWRELDFSPFMPPEMSAVVMEGLVAHQQAATVDAANSSRAEVTSKANAERKERMAAAIKKLASLRYQEDPMEVEAAGRALENAMSALSSREAAIEALQAHGSAQTATPASVVAAGDGPTSMTTEPAWRLTKPKRFQGYRKPLYDLLKTAHVAGQPLPSARDVLDSWKEKPPPDVAEVTDNGLKYYDAQGNTKPADLEAIRKTIGRITN